MPLPKDYCYRPLPDEVELFSSLIHGHGIHSRTHLRRRQIIGKTHWIIGGQTVRTPLGGYLNHSDVPNCELSKSSGEGFSVGFVSIDKGLKADVDIYPDYYLLITRGEILPGEELTVNYNDEFCGTTKDC